MRYLLALGACAAVLGCGIARADNETAELPILPDGGVLIDYSETCGGPISPTSGPYDTGFAWQYGGIEGLDGGAFAECLTFPSGAELCSVFMDVSQLGSWVPGGPVEVFVWMDEGGEPGEVVSMATAGLGTMGTWPEVSRHFIPIDACVIGRAWFGCQADWPGEAAQWFVCADLNSGNGCAMTRVAPGLEYPSGWTSVENVWQTTRALGLGVEVTDAPCTPNPTSQTTWGRIKSLYR